MTIKVKMYRTHTLAHIYIQSVRREGQVGASAPLGFFMGQLS